MGTLPEDCGELPRAAPAPHRSRKHPSYAAKPLNFLLLVCLFDDLPVQILVLQQPPQCASRNGENGPRNPAHAGSANATLHKAEELIRPLQPPCRTGGHLPTPATGEGSRDSPNSWKTTGSSKKVSCVGLQSEASEGKRPKRLLVQKLC